VFFGPAVLLDASEGGETAAGEEEGFCRARGSRDSARGTGRMWREGNLAAMKALKAAAAVVRDGILSSGWFGEVYNMVMLMV
jgi:hypothetical protein